MSTPVELTSLLALYQDYLKGYADRVVSSGPFQGLHKFLLGSSTPADRKADTAFYQAVEGAVAALIPALSGPGDPAAARAVRYMLLEADGPDGTSRLMMEAAQALAIPLLDFLTAEERTAILADYQTRYPKKRMLSPRQRELLTALGG